MQSEKDNGSAAGAAPLPAVASAPTAWAALNALENLSGNIFFDAIPHEKIAVITGEAAKHLRAVLDAVDGAPLSEIVARMREYAPSLRGVGMTASDARYNSTLRDADTLEALARKTVTT